MQLKLCYTFVELYITQTDYKIPLVLEVLTHSYNLFRSNMRKNLELVAYSN